MAKNRLSLLTWRYRSYDTVSTNALQSHYSVISRYQPEGLLYDAERDILAIAKFLVMSATATP